MNYREGDYAKKAQASCGDVTDPSRPPTLTERLRAHQRHIDNDDIGPIAAAEINRLTAALSAAERERASLRTLLDPNLDEDLLSIVKRIVQSRDAWAKATHAAETERDSLREQVRDLKTRETILQNRLSDITRHIDHFEEIETGDRGQHLDLLPVTRREVVLREQLAQATWERDAHKLDAEKCSRASIHHSNRARELADKLAAAHALIVDGL